MKEKNNRKSIIERLIYAYLRRIKRRMLCPACQEGNLIIKKKSNVWTCEACGYKLPADEFEDDYIFWFCDKCGAYLNNQEEFDRKKQQHVCKKCGYENDTSLRNLKGLCSRCGETIPDPNGNICAACKEKRRTAVKAWLIILGGAAAAAAALAGIILLFVLRG